MRIKICKRCLFWTDYAPSRKANDNERVGECRFDPTVVDKFANEWCSHWKPNDDHAPDGERLADSTPRGAGTR